MGVYTCLPMETNVFTTSLSSPEYATRPSAVSHSKTASRAMSLTEPERAGKRPVVDENSLNVKMGLGGIDLNLNKFDFVYTISCVFLYICSYYRVWMRIINCTSRRKRA